MKQEDILAVPTTSFVPFRKDNILPRFETSFRITDPNLKISAASAFYPTMAGICQNLFDPGCFTERKSLDKTFNAKGFSDLAEGKIDMYVSLASEKNLELVKKSLSQLRCVPLFRDPLAVLVNVNNGVRNLSLTQLKAIYSGEIQNWKDVGGADSKISTYQLVAENNVSRIAFNLGITEQKPTNLPQSDIETMPELVNIVGDDELAIGNIFWSYYAKMYRSIQTKLIAIDGVEPTSKDYPLCYNVCMFYDAGNKKEELHRLVEYLSADEGRRLVDLAYRGIKTIC